MRRLIIAGCFVLACALGSHPVSAFWQSRLQIGIATASGYQGPGDVVSGGIAFYSCGRAYNAAYATALNAACDVVDTSTGLTSCTLHFLSTGFVNITSCNATSCAVACSVSKMYDQTGNGNHVVQATLANMPALTFNALNSLPCPAGTGGAAMTLQSAGNITQAAPFTFTAVAERTGSFTSFQMIFTNGQSTNPELRFHNGANTVDWFPAANGFNLTAADSAFHAIVASALTGGATGFMAIDSSGNTGTGATAGTATMANTQQVMNWSTGAFPLKAGFFCEGGVWPSDMSLGPYTSMLSNMRSALNGWNF